MPAESQAFGAEDFAAATNVSHETLGRLKTYADMLAEWNAVHNLVSRNSMSDLWRRHFLDSAQLAPLVPLKARSLIDLGSGAGFPGLVLAEELVVACFIGRAVDDALFDEEASPFIVAVTGQQRIVEVE